MLKPKVRLSNADFVSCFDKDSKLDDPLFYEQRAFIRIARTGLISTPLKEVATLPFGGKVMATKSYIRPSFLIVSSNLKASTEDRIRATMVNNWNALSAAAKDCPIQAGVSRFFISIFSPRLTLDAPCESYFLMLDVPDYNYAKILGTTVGKLKTSKANF